MMMYFVSKNWQKANSFFFIKPFDEIHTKNLQYHLLTKYK